MSLTYDAVIAELDYRRERLMAEADGFRLAKQARRRPAGEATIDRWELVRDGTDRRDYAPAA